MELIQEDAALAFKDSGVMGALIAKVVNTCRQTESGECSLLLSGDISYAEGSVEKMFGILSDFKLKPRREQWKYHNGHPPLVNQHIYQITKTILREGYEVPEKMLFVNAKDVLEFPDICGRTFKEIHDVFQPAQPKQEGDFLLSPSGCELLITGKNRNIKKAIVDLNDLFNALTHQSKEKFIISPIPSVIDSGEFHFFRISKA